MATTPHDKAKIAAAQLVNELHWNNRRLWIYQWLDGCRKAYGQRQ